MKTGEASPQNRHLARRLSPLHVWALALGCIIGWGSFILPGTTFLPAAGPGGTALAMAIAAVVMVVIATNYSYLVRRFPVAGGEYAYVSNSFGKTHAFICAWLLGLCYLTLVAQNATALALVARHVAGGIFQVGPHYSIAGFNIYIPELVLAWVVLAVFAVLSIRGVLITGIFQTVLVLAIVGGIGLVLCGMFVQQGSILNASGLQPAFSPHHSPSAGILMVLAIAPFAFVGFDTVPQAAEEYHFPARRAHILIVVAIVCGAVLYSSLAYLGTAATPDMYADWPSYIDASANLEGIEALPTFYAAQKILGPVGLGVLLAAALGAILSGIVGFYMATSRLLFALGRDGVLPSWFGCLHARFRTPHRAILFIFVVSAFAPLFGRTVLGWLVDMSALGAAVAYLYTSLVTIKHSRAQGSSVMLFTGIAGTVFSCMFVVLLLVPIPSLSSSLGPESYVCLVLWIVLGLVFYLYSTPGAAMKLVGHIFPTIWWKSIDSWRLKRRYKYFSSLEEKDYANALAWWFRRATGKELNLENPQSYDEKIQWLKLYDATPEKGRLSDKYLVRAWVAERVGEEYLIPLLGVWDRPEDIDWNALPRQFVLKATHGCEWNILVPNKDQLDLNKARQQLRTWLNTEYAFTSAFELQYRYCEPRIIAEAYLEADEGGSPDYKFFCFNGMVACIAVIRGRESSPEEACYDCDWKRLPCTYYGHARMEGDVPRPGQLQEAIRIAESLAAGFPHVRVDLYLPRDGTVRFGEMTFTTASGNTRWDPPEYNAYFGDMIDLDILPRRKEQLNHQEEGK